LGDSRPSTVRLFAVWFIDCNELHAEILRVARQDFLERSVELRDDQFGLLAFASRDSLFPLSTSVNSSTSNHRPTFR
jgi:hypothetical protein